MKYITNEVSEGKREVQRLFILRNNMRKKLDKLYLELAATKRANTVVRQREVEKEIEKAERAFEIRKTNYEKAYTKLLHGAWRTG